MLSTARMERDKGVGSALSCLCKTPLILFCSVPSMPQTELNPLLHPQELQTRGPLVGVPCGLRAFVIQGLVRIRCFVCFTCEINSSL